MTDFFTFLKILFLDLKIGSLLHAQIVCMQSCGEEVMKMGHIIAACMKNIYFYFHLFK